MPEPGSRKRHIIFGENVFFVRIIFNFVLVVVDCFIRKFIFSKHIFVFIVRMLKFVLMAATYELNSFLN